MQKYAATGRDSERFGGKVNSVMTASEKALMQELARFNEMMENACSDMAPHKICAFIYDLSNTFNKFYHENNIMTEENEEKQAGFVNLLKITRRTLETCIDLLGFEAPEQM